MSWALPKSSTGSDAVAIGGAPGFELLALESVLADTSSFEGGATSPSAPEQIDRLFVPKVAAPVRPTAERVETTPSTSSGEDGAWDRAWALEVASNESRHPQAELRASLDARLVEFPMAFSEHDCRRPGNTKDASGVVTRPTGAADEVAMAAPLRTNESAGAANDDAFGTLADADRAGATWRLEVDRRHGIVVTGVALLAAHRAWRSGGEWTDEEHPTELRLRRPTGPTSDRPR